MLVSSAFVTGNCNQNIYFVDLKAEKVVLCGKSVTLFKAADVVSSVNLSFTHNSFLWSSTLYPSPASSLFFFPMSFLMEFRALSIGLWQVQSNIKNLILETPLCRKNEAVLKFQSFNKEILFSVINSSYKVFQRPWKANHRFLIYFGLAHWLQRSWKFWLCRVATLCSSVFLKHLLLIHIWVI